ncbi:MAG TPA: serine hydrolase, partial [Thermoanaerobaculia bacterium]|nr:serine hydrolase [Thermoanaerobaculia bacterium]
TDEDALFLIARQKGLDFVTGTKHGYSNTGYFLLSQVVRRVTGQPLSEFATRRLLHPLGMTSSSYLDDHTRIIPRKASAYSPKRDGGFRIDASNWEQTGDGGLQTTVLDLAKWDANFYDPKLGGQGLVAELQTPGSLSSGRALKYALGLRVDEYRGLARVAHGGSWAGFRAQLLRFPQERFSAIVLCNLSTAGPAALATKVAELYLNGRMLPAEKLPEPTSAAVSSTEIELWSGLYWNRETDDLLRIRGETGKLLARHGDGPERELLALGGGRFVRKDDPESRVLFSRGRGRSLRLENDEEAWTYEAVQEVSPTPAALAGYTGHYYSEELDSHYVLLLEKDRLRLRRRGSETSTLRPVFADAFWDPEGAGLLRFIRSGPRRVTGFEVAAGSSKIPFGRVAEEGR